MDLGSPDDAGGGRKIGLARLAKACSLNNVNAIENKQEDKDDQSSLHDSTKSHEPQESQQTSPTRSLVKQSGTVNLLPNKMNVSALSGQQSTSERRNRSMSSDESSYSFESHGQMVPCSDPDFIKSSKSSLRPTQPHAVANSKEQAAVSDKAHHSPLLAHRSRLSPPQIKRSSSMTRLSEAINQIHNICVFPAQPLVVTEKSEVSHECNVSPKILTSCPPLSEPRSDSGRPGSWYGSKTPSEGQTSLSSGEREYKGYGYKPEDSSFQNCRSASLDELSNIHILPGLPSLSPADAKKRNYLFGGLGYGSLLGSKELDRYFPNRTVTIFIATWNMNGKEPPANLEEFLLPEAMEHVPDMYVVGTQESGGSRSEWEVRLQATIGPSHALFTSAVFGVLHLTIFMRRDLLWFCSVPEEDTYSLRPGIAYKTKGGMAIGFQFFGTRLLFINSHLTAHEEKQALRVQNFKNICQALDLPRLLPVKTKHKDITHRYDCVFWLGDLNFRLAVSRDQVFQRLKKATPETYQHLLQWDQLYQARHKGEAFSEFEEGPITFPPTFKYDPGTDHYDTSTKQRVPSYTDRILYKSSRGAVTCCSYDSCPLFRTSDHKPVSGIFQCKIRPGRDDVPLAAGLFNRDVFLEALRRRKRFVYQPALSNCPVQ